MPIEIDDDILQSPYGALPECGWLPIDWPSCERAMAVRGARITYVDCGDASAGQSPVLLIHGMGASYRTWLTAIPSLSATRRVIAVDLPGFGMSDRPRGVPDARQMASILDEFCAFLGIATVSVVGHSLGGLLAMQFTHMFPQRVDRLAIVSASLNTVLSLFKNPLATLRRQPRVCLSFGWQLLAASIPIPDTIVRLVLHHRLLRVVMCWPYVSDPARVHAPTMAHAFSSTGRIGSVYAAIRARSFTLDRIARELSTNDHEILVVVGTHDRLAGTEDSAFLCARIARARLVTLENTGHWPMLERPVALNHLLHAWLETSADPPAKARPASPMD